MSVVTELRVILEAMGPAQQAFVFAWLTAYPLALGRLLAPRGRRRAAALAALAAAGFVGVTDPWTHGVLMVVLATAAMGGFIVLAWLLDRLPRLLPGVALAAADRPPAAAPEAARERPAGHPAALPLNGRAGIP